MNEANSPGNSTEAIDHRSIYISSVSAVTALFFFGVGLPCWYAFDLAWGVGLGAMCAFWGGPGFGVMAAGARVSMYEERLEAASSGGPLAAVADAPGLLVAAI